VEVVELFVRDNQDKVHNLLVLEQTVEMEQLLLLMEHQQQEQVVEVVMERTMAMVALEVAEMQVL
jgi:hypothetical protein